MIVQTLIVPSFHIHVLGFGGPQDWHPLYSIPADIDTRSIYSVATSSEMISLVSHDLKDDEGQRVVLEETCL